MRITENSQVMLTKDQVSSDVGGERVILNLKTGIYYGLDPIGARVWNLVKKPIRVIGLRDALLKEYEVEAAALQSDLLALLKELLSAGLIEIVDER